MPVLSFLKRKDNPAAASAVDPAASVESARTRARRRLIGAAVLVGLGIIGFPLLFETQPRPIGVDIPIEILPREAAPPGGTAAPKIGPVPTPRAVAPVVGERAAEAPIEPAAAAAAPASAAMSPAAAAAATPQRSTAPASAAAVRIASSAAGVAAAAAAAGVARDAQRAQALLDAKPVASAAITPAPAAAASTDAAARFVVQAGAYTDAAALRDARQKVEKLGLKTYTQVIDTDSGPRTRVRVGPFASREEADRAATRIKASGLAANILSL